MKLTIFDWIEDRLTSIGSNDLGMHFGYVILRGHGLTATWPGRCDLVEMGGAIAVLLLDLLRILCINPTSQPLKRVDCEPEGIPFR